MLDVSIDLGLVGVGTVIASEQKKKKKMSENSSSVQRLQIPGGKDSRQRSHGMRLSMFAVGQQVFEERAFEQNCRSQAVLA